MARARNIKPGFYKNENLAECSIWARYLFPGLWMMADRKGRLEDRPKRIKAEILPFDSQDVEPLLRELEAKGFIERYQNSDGRFIQISKFSTHQTPHYSEKESVIKPPNSENDTVIKTPLLQENIADECDTIPRGLQEDSEKSPAIKMGSQPPDSLNPDSLNPDSLNPDSLNPDSTPSAASEKISLSAAGAWTGITPAKHGVWKAAYPAIDLDAELAAAAAWAIENPKNRKSNWGRFLANWLKRSQDRAPAKGNGKPVVQAVTCEFRGEPFNPAQEPCGMAGAQKGAFYGGRAICPHHQRLLDDSRTGKTEMPDDVRKALADLVRAKTA